MKRFYLLTLAACALSLSVNAQIIDDDFEFYTLGDMGLQNTAVWSAWDGVPDGGLNIIVVDDITIETQSGYIGPNSVQDCILLLANQTSGDYTLQWQMYITGGSTGYFNIQGATEDPGTGFQGVGNGGAGVFNSSNMFFNNAGGAPGVFEDQGTTETGSYPEDAWFTVSIYFDMDAGTPTYAVTIEGVLINTTPVPFADDTTLGAIDFFSIDANNNYWVDNVLFVDGLIQGTNDFAAGNFSVYPNPVTDILNIRSTNTVDAIAVYDVLGKLVLSTTPDTISPSINMSALTSGVYLVKVTIGDSSKTVKVIR
jgi:Secretion system C-terminal sorting domain